MRYFVTGATGFLGGRIVRILAAEGHQVVALARDADRARPLTDLGIEIVLGDVTDKESMRTPMVGVDGVFHIAGWYKVGVRDVRPGRRVNVDGTRNVLELMRDLQIPKGVYTSTLAVFGDTHGRSVDETYRFDGRFLTEYDRTKWMAHYEVAEPMMQEGLPLVVVLPGVIYGPSDPSIIGDTIRRYLRHRLPAVPVRTAFCWAHVDDVARGHILAMEHGQINRDYIIAGPAHSLIGMLRVAEEITGIPAPRIHLPPWLVRSMSVVTGLVERLLPVPEAYTAEVLRDSAGVTYLGSNARARRELGYTVRSLEAGLQTTLPAEMERLGLSAS